MRRCISKPVPNSIQCDAVHFQFPSCSPHGLCPDDPGPPGPICPGISVAPSAFSFSNVWFRDIFRIARLYVQSYSTPVVSLLSLHYNVLPGEKTRAVICELCHLASGILQTETNACYTPAAFSTPEELAKKKREIWKARENCKYCT